MKQDQDRITLFKNALDYLVKKNKLTQKDLADAVGYSQRSINGILNKKENKKPTLKLEKRILQYFRVSHQEMMEIGRAIANGENIEEGEKNLPWNDSTENPRLVKVPIISWNQVESLDRVAKGFRLDESEDWVGLYRSESDRVFALKIKGDTMSPEFNPGDIIIVDPELEPETGDFAVTRIIGDDNGNDEILFKQLMVDGNRVYLKSMNRDYPSIEITGREYQVIGCVIQKQYVKKYYP